MAAWVGKKKRLPKIGRGGERQNRRTKVEVVHGVPVRSMRRFRVALSGPTQGLTLEAASAAAI